MLKELKLAKLYLYLCITTLVNIVASMCVSVFVSELAQDFVMLVGVVAMVVQVILVFALRKYSAYFKKGFVLITIAFVLSALAYSRTLVSGLTTTALMSVSYNDIGFFILPLIMAVVAVIIELFAAYYMFSGHAAILMDIDDGLATKWKRLFTWRTIGTIAEALSIIIIFLSVGLGVVLILLSSIALIVIQCLEVYYLYKTHEALREQETKENADPVVDV